MLWQTVQILVHAGTRMMVDSCVAVPAASSMWTVQRRRNCEDRSGLCVSVERQGRHAQLNAGTDSWGSRRPIDTWWRDSSVPGCEDCWTPARTVWIPHAVGWAASARHRVLWQRCCRTSAYGRLVELQRWELLGAAAGGRRVRQRELRCSSRSDWRQSVHEGDDSVGRQHSSDGT